MKYLLNATPGISAQLSDFGGVLIFILGALAFVMVALFVARLLRPARPNEEKLTTYECGEEPTGGAWSRFNTRFYIIALIFILFEVELVFLFPWATVFGQKELITQTGGQWGWFSVAEMFIFVAVLALGLAYTWRKGYLDWIKPAPTPTQSTSSVPMDVYKEYNRKMERKTPAKAIQ